MKVLLVENTQSKQLAISRCVDRMAMQIVHCNSGHAALDAFRDEQPDLILTDITLPDMDGPTLAHCIRQAEEPGSWTPILFLCGPADEGSLAQGLNAGGDDYLLKPISEIVLDAKLRAMQRIIQMRTSLVVLTRKLDTANQELKRLSSMDSLTGVANRRHFDESLAREWRRAQRNQNGLGLLLCDIDHFKLYNDSYGHQAGDQCLHRVAQAIAASADRGGDLVARYGGEEFAVILPDTSPEGAVVVAERVRRSIDALAMPHTVSEQGHVTLSIGVTFLFAGQESKNMPDDLVLQADQALYRAKELGRNRISLAHESAFASKQFLH
jgi:diguanylate cyclase (GGDEF)-like protein